MTDEAREAAIMELAIAISTDHMLRASESQVLARRGFDAGFDAGVVEGIRQAREAVDNAPVTWHRGMYGSPDDMYARIAIVRAFEALTT